jgi:oxaloacetate decarboxylase beta subunit
LTIYLKKLKIRIKSFHLSIMIKKILLSHFLCLLFLLPLKAAENKDVLIQSTESGIIKKIFVSENQQVLSGDKIVHIDNKGSIITIYAGVSGKIHSLNIQTYQKIEKGQVLGKLLPQEILVGKVEASEQTELPAIKVLLKNLLQSTGIYAFISLNQYSFNYGIGKIFMILIGLLILFLGISKNFEPLLLIPIGFGCLLANTPLAEIAEEGGLLYYIFEIGIDTGVFPLIIFMGVGALTDFGPMIANPKTALLGAAAQFGIFLTLGGALLLNFIPGINFSFKDAASIGIIGGADGPTAIFLSSQLSPHLLGSIAVAAYSYMALVPIIQPPIMRLLTNKAERKIEMKQLRYVSKREKIFFPLIVFSICLLLLPSAAPLIGMLMFGNLLKECGVVDRLADTTQNALINIVTIFLGLGVGSKLSAEKFINLQTLGILLLGLVAFCIGTATGVVMGKVMKRFSKEPLNPLIGAAGVSAVPMAARVVNKVGLENNPQNFLLMHAMGPNVSGVIGSAVAAGILLATLN